MATWNTDAADYVLRANQADYNRDRQDRLDAQAAEKLEYDQNRQNRLDAQAAEIHTLKTKMLKREQEIADLKYANDKKNLPATQKLTELSLQNKITEQQNKQDADAYSRRPISILNNAKYKALARIPLSKKEKASLEEYYPLRTVGVDDQERTLPVDEYIRLLYKENPNDEDFKNINPRLFPFFVKEYKSKAAESQKNNYTNIKSRMTGLYNKYNPNPEKNDSKRMELIVNAATNIYQNTPGLSEEDAMKQALGQSNPNEYATPEEILFRQHGTKYTDLSDDQKAKLLYAFDEYNKKRAEMYSQIKQGDYIKEHDTLLELEKFWNIAMDQAGIKGITSPMHQRFLQLNSADVL